MRIGPYRFSPRFLIVLGAVVVGIVVGVSILPSNNSQQKALQALYTPALSPSAFSQLQPGWTGRYQSAFGLHRPVSANDFLGANFVPAVGEIMKLEVVPLGDTSNNTGLGSYSFRLNGFVFMPAVFIPPDTPTTVQDLQSSVDPSSINFIQLGFPAAAVPQAGVPISVTAMMWGRSDVLRTAVPNRGQSEQAGPAAPVFLVDGYEPLQEAQLRAPATQETELNLQYQEAGQELTIHRVEWSAGAEVRLLVTLSNLGTKPIGLWSGLGSSTAQLPQQATVSGQPDGSLATAGSLEAQQSVTGYIVFGPQAVSPNQTLTLRMPALGSGFGSNDQNLIIISVKPQTTVG